MTTQALSPGFAAPSWAWLRRLTLIDRAQRPSPEMLDRLAAAIAEQEHLLASVMCLRDGYTAGDAALSAQINSWLAEASRGTLAARSSRRRGSASTTPGRRRSACSPMTWWRPTAPTCASRPPTR